MRETWKDRIGSQEGWGAEELRDRLGRWEKYSFLKNKEILILGGSYKTSAKKGS